MSLQRKAILITRRTRYEELVAQYNTESQAAFVIKSRGQDFNDYKIEDQIYKEAIQQVEVSLSQNLRVQRLDRDFLSNFLFAQDDVVVVVGQDGLVANTLKYLNGQPVLAINPDPQRFDGVLLPFEVKDTRLIVNDVLSGNYQSKSITMAKATLNDGQVITAVNDIYIGPRLPTSARYEIEYKDKKEVQSSSGIIISTGLGSTGWLSSIVRGAEQIAGVRSKTDASFAWGDQRLKFAVREPFPSTTTGTELVYGDINQNQPLIVSSMMAGGGVIFSDGMVDDYIEFNSGALAKLGLTQNQGQLLV